MRTTWAKFFSITLCAGQNEDALDWPECGRGAMDESPYSVLETDRRRIWRDGGHPPAQRIQRTESPRQISEVAASAGSRKGDGRPSRSSLSLSVDEPSEQLSTGGYMVAGGG